MSKIPTAEEFLNEIKYITYSTEEKLITFAKLHVEACKKEIIKNAKTDYNYLGEGGEFEDIPIYEYFVDKDSILNAYPLENIK